MSRSPNLMGSPSIANVMSKLNNIKSNINNLKSQPKSVNSGKNAKIKYLDDKIEEAKSWQSSQYKQLVRRLTTLKQEGKTDNEIQLDKQYKTYETLAEKYFDEREKLEEEKKAIIMSGGKTRRNKRKNRKTRKSN